MVGGGRGASFPQRLLPAHIVLSSYSPEARLLKFLSFGVHSVADAAQYSNGLQMGMVLEPGGVSNQLVTATATGKLKFIDFRMHDASGGRLGVYKTLDAHSKGSLSAVVGHPHAPLIATGTTTQVTKDAPSPSVFAPDN